MDDPKNDAARRDQIARAGELGVCPNCDKPLGEDRVGSGRLSDGVFCSLDCIAMFHHDYFSARIRTLPSES
jgi:hypothetical protein